MSYYVDDQKITLRDLMSRLRETDLVPSRQALLEDIENRFEALNNNSIRVCFPHLKGMVTRTPKAFLRPVRTRERDRKSLICRALTERFSKKLWRWSTLPGYSGSARRLQVCFFIPAISA